jgi:hypothetical protein
VVRRIAAHRVATAVQRIEARVGVPRLVEMNAIDAGAEQLLHATGVVAQAVVGRVGDHRVDRPRVNVRADERVGGQRRVDRLPLQALRRDRADDAVPIAERHEVRRNATGEHEPVLDRLVAVAIAQRDLVPADGGGHDHAVGRGRAVGDAIGAMRAEHARRVSLVLADRPRVIEEGAQGADADRQVGAQQVLAEVVEEDSADR